MFNFRGIKIRHYLTSFIMMIVAIFVTGYLYLLNSSAYEFAKDFLSKNSQVIQEIGSIKSTRPGLFNSSIHYSGGEAWAKIRVILKGSEKSAEAKLDMVNSGNIWTVKEGILLLENGNTITLTP